MKNWFGRADYHQQQQQGAAQVTGSELRMLVAQHEATDRLLNQIAAQLEVVIARLDHIQSRLPGPTTRSAASSC